MKAWLGVAAGWAIVGNIIASENPVPFNEMARELAETVIVEGLGATPYGKVPVGFYKASEFAREIGEAALEHQDTNLQADLILINADAALLRGLHKQGYDLGGDPKAVAAKARLQQMVNKLDSGSETGWQHLRKVVANNLPYAVAKVGLDKSTEGGIRWFLKRSFVGKIIKAILPLGDEFAGNIGNRSALKPALRYIGWRKFGTRAATAGRYIDKITEQILDAQFERIMKKKIASVSDHVLDNLYQEVMSDHPSKPVQETRMRLIFVRNPEFIPLPAAALPVAADPVARTIYVEDSLRRSYSVSQSNSTTTTSPAAPEPRDLKAEARRQALHDELMRVGDGKTYPNNGNWDGKRGGTLTSK